MDISYFLLLAIMLNFWHAYNWDIDFSTFQLRFIFAIRITDEGSIPEMYAIMVFKNSLRV